MLSAICAQQEQAPAPAPPPVLENHGAPIVVPFSCTNEDIRSGGLGCTQDEPCAIFLELTAADSAGPRIFAAGNIHTEAVTLYSILLASDDDGKTWTEAHERIRAAGLDRIHFLDSQTGWITGAELSPLPQNPFLLTTSDGGKTWLQHPVLNDNADIRFGFVQQISMPGKTSGSLVVDRGLGSDPRYALFESPDAGETWQIHQESSKPIVLPQPAAPSAAWRVRPDAATKAFVIEHRVSAGWHSVSSFAVRLAPCVPPPAG